MAKDFHRQFSPMDFQGPYEQWDDYKFDYPPERYEICDNPEDEEIEEEPEDDLAFSDPMEKVSLFLQSLNEVKFRTGESGTVDCLACGGKGTVSYKKISYKGSIWAACSACKISLLT